MSMSAYSAASPAILGDRLFVGTFASQVICVRWRDQEGVRGANLAPTKVAPTAESGGSALAWAYEHPRKKFPYYSSPAVGPIGDAAKKRRWVVVVGGRDKMVHALDAKNGEALWTFAAGAKVDSSPVISGDRVWIGSSNGEILALDLRSGKVQ